MQTLTMFPESLSEPAKPTRGKPKSNRKGNVNVPQGMDCCQTPAYAIGPLMPYLKALGGTIWEPAAGKGNLVAIMRQSGLKVVASDLQTGQNFFTYRPDEPIAGICTNIPFSIKLEWFTRCYELGIPFANLTPVDTIGMKVQRLMERWGFEMMLLDHRVNFEMPNLGYDGSGAQFPVMWLCHHVLPQQVMFGHIDFNFGLMQPLFNGA